MIKLRKKEKDSVVVDGDKDEGVVTLRVDDGRVVSYNEVESAILDSEGFMTTIAAKLRTSVFKAKKLIEKHPKLQKTLEEFRESHLDAAERKLLQKISLGDTVALIFYLKCIGKNRGYVERTDVQPQRRPVRIKVVPAVPNADKDGRMKRLNAEKSRGKKIQSGTGEENNVVSLFGDASN